MTRGIGALACVFMLTLASSVTASQSRRLLSSNPNDALNKAIKALSKVDLPPADADPKVYGAYELLKTKSNVVGTQVALIPFTSKWFFAERPSNRHPDPASNAFNAITYDYKTQKQVNIFTNSSLENCALSYGTGDQLYVIAGHKPQSRYPEGRRGIRALNETASKLDTLSQLQYGHWLATATVLPDNKIMVMSDSPNPVSPPAKSGVKNPFYEIWDPANPTEPTTIVDLPNSFFQASKGRYFYYPFVFVLPSGDIFAWSNTVGAIMNPYTGKVLHNLPRLPDRRIQTQYPWGASAVMMPLTPEDNYECATILIAGGGWDYGWINTTAVDQLHTIKICYTDGNYTIDKAWTAVKMPLPRVTGSAVLLPNGQVLLIGGAMNGLMGDSAAGNVAMANNPNFWPVLYNPAKKIIPKRYTILARSQIPRMLHSSHGLNPDGTILATGCDRCSRFWSASNYSASPEGFLEYRNEIFRTPFSFDLERKPTILDWPTDDIVELGYDQVFDISFSIPDSAANVASVALVAPSSDTHTFNMHQRVVQLEILNQEFDGNHMTGDQVTVRMPPNANIAPPGPYMLFLVSSKGDVYSDAVWVKVAPQAATAL